MNVLFAEKDIHMRDYISLLLEASLDCSVMEASSEAEIYSVFDFEEEISLLLIDLATLSKDHAPIIETIVKKNIITVIFSSDENDIHHQTVKTILELNDLNAFIRKPFKDNDFFPLIENISKQLDKAPNVSDEMSSDSHQKENWSFSHNGSENANPNEELGRFQKEVPGAEMSQTQSSRTAWNFGGIEEEKDQHSSSRIISLKNDDPTSGGKSKNWNFGDSRQENYGEVKYASEEEKKLGNVKQIEEDQRPFGDVELKSENEIKDGQVSREKESDEELGGILFNESDDEDFGSVKEVDDDELSLGGVKKDSSDEELKSNVFGAGHESSDHSEHYKVSAQAKQKVPYDEEEKLASVDETDENSDIYNDCEYKEVRLRRFLYFEKSCCDVYIRIGTKKFVKLLKENDSGIQPRIQSYKNKGLSSLYVREGCYKKISLFYKNLVQENLSKAMESNNTNEIIQSQLACFDSIIQLVKDFQLTNEIIELVEECIFSISAMAKETKNLNGIMKSIMEGDDFISEHSLLLSYIIGRICLGTSWAKDQSMNKLMMAAIFHDIKIDNSELAKYHVINEELKNSLDSQSLESVQEHPSLAAAILNDSDCSYSDVDTIILQHHERPDQSGFPEGIGSLKIDPISCIFIIASEYTDYLLMNSKYRDLSLEELKEAFSEHYGQGNFKKPLEVFLKSF